MASREGELLIHLAGQNRTSWSSAAAPDFLESMADACKAVLAFRDADPLDGVEYTCEDYRTTPKE